MELPKIGIVIVHGHNNDKWFQDCLQSCQMQLYPNFMIQIEENIDRSRTIGKCWNDAVDKLEDCKYIYFVGDDDFLSSDMLFSSVTALEMIRTKDPLFVQISTYITMIDERGDQNGYMMKIPTGLWLREWLIKYKFDEKLKRLVDATQLDRIKQVGNKMQLLNYHFGYFYRQHGGQVTGRKYSEWDTVSTWNRKIYADPCMDLFLNGFIENHGFIYVPQGRIGAYDDILIFGIYSPDTLNIVSATIRPIKVCWCGSDLIEYRDKWSEKTDLSKNPNIKHLCLSADQQKELKKLNIDATITRLYYGKKEDWEVLPFPENPGVLYYTPERWDLYGVQDIIEIAKLMPDVQFHFVGDKGLIHELPSNVINHGVVSKETLKTIMNKIGVYARFTKWDGHPNLITESILSGKYVVTNHNIPYTERVNERFDTIKIIRKLLKKGKPNKSGAEAYQKQINDWSFL
ncbi:MAG: glycosyltransferase family 1 protein [Planctomycetaceae bacterium]|nr:MAG: glycosyltransferase family 1 protein [Planctomycetaceae bacterium]